MGTFESKKSEALRILEATDIQPSNYLPPAIQLLWRLGLEVPPPHFASFTHVVLLSGTYFALPWGAGMYAMSMLGIVAPVMSVRGFVAFCAGAGVFFGLGMATYYAYGRRKYCLPSWEALGRDVNVQP